MDKKLKEILDYVNEKSKFYRKIKQNNEENRNCLSEFPIMSKEVLYENYDEIICDTQEEIIFEYTSGSSGIPLKCQKTISERASASLAIWKRRRAIDEEVNINNFISVWEDRNIHNKIAEIDQKNIVNTIKYIMKKNPRWLSGPISILKLYAECIENNKIEYCGCIKYIELMGEYVSKEDRKYVEKIFGAKAVIMYGLREVWGVAYECPYGRLHIMDEMIYLEIVNKNKYLQEEEGEIVLTSFNNKRMPLIRYKTGDIGRINSVSCECGCSAAVLELIGGRIMEIIRGKNIMGNIFWGRIGGKVSKCFPESIQAFWVEQVEINTFNFYLVKGKGFIFEVLGAITERAQEGLGKDIVIKYKFEKNANYNDNGKRKVFCCMMK